MYRIGRRELLTLISSMMALTALAIDLMLPAFDEIRETFDLADGSADTSRIITVFFFGLAAGQLFYGPLTDRLGRKPTLYIGLAVYLLGAIGSAVAPSYGLLLASRFIWGVGAAGASVVASTIVRDRFEGVEMAKAMSQIMAVFVLVPIIAPSFGALIIAVLPWQATFWLCAVLAVGVVLWSLRMKETLAVEDRRPLQPSVIASGYMQVIRTPVTFGYMIAMVFFQASFIAYLTSFDVIMDEVFDRAEQFPFVFGAVALLFGAAALVNGRVVERLGIDGVVNRAFAAIFVLQCVLGLIVWQSDGRPQFWVFVPILGLMISCFMFLMPNLNSAAMVPVGEIAGTASAMTGAVRVALGALFGGLVSSRVVDSTTPLVVGIVVLTACAALAVGAVRRSERRAAEAPLEALGTV